MQPAHDGGEAALKRRRPAARLVWWRRLVLLCLILGYCGYYFTRVNLSVATPSILRDDNYTKAEFGAVVTASYAGNMASKFITGPFIDKVGGKALLLTGGVGSVACAILFVSLSLTGIPGLSVAAALNRVNQALGWGAVLKVISKWFDGKHRARATGLASAGYFLSDAVARLALGGVLSLSQGIPGAEMNWTRPWQIMYYASAGAGLVLLLPVIFGVRESPENLGEVEAEQGEGTLYDDEPAFSDAPVVGGTESLTSSSSQTTLSSPDADASTESAKVPSDSEKQHLITPSSPLRTGKSDEVAKPVAAAPPRGGWKQDLIVLLRSPRYLLLLVQSVCLSLVREVFNSWTPVFFSESLKFSDASSASASLLFPISGAISILIFAPLLDVVPRKLRAVFSTLLTLFLIASLVVLGQVAASEQTSENPVASLALVAASAVFIVPPYAFLDGPYTLDIAGKRLAGTAAQLVNGFGFIGALVSGSAAGAVADESGWSGVFTTLSIVAAVSAVASMLYWVLDARAVAKRQANVVEIVAPTETTPLLS